MLGAFLTRDPVEGVMERAASRNGYGYVEGNPVNYTDPSGMCPNCVPCSNLKGQAAAYVQCLVRNASIGNPTCNPCPGGYIAGGNPADAYDPQCVFRDGTSARASVFWQQKWDAENPREPNGWRDIAEYLGMAGAIVAEIGRPFARRLVQSAGAAASDGPFPFIGDAIGLGVACWAGIEGIMTLVNLFSATGTQSSTKKKGCTAARREELQDKVNQHCKNLPFGCDETLECNKFETYWRRADKCHRARVKIMRECFNGGDETHQEQAKQAERAYENCQAIYQRKCSGNGGTRS